MNYWVTKADPKHYYKDEFYKKGKIDKKWWTYRVPTSIQPLVSKPFRLGGL